MKYAATVFSLFFGFILASFMFGWIFLFAVGIAKNTLVVNIPNPLYLADCYTLKDEPQREYACDRAWK